MLARHRRYMGLLVAGLFGFLLVSNLIPDPMGRGEWRARVPAEWSWDRRLNLWFRNVTDYVQDNFGFRATLPLFRRWARVNLASPDSRPIYVGRDGHLFWGREATPEQSAGALVRAQDVGRFIAMVGEMQRVLAPQGTRIVVALPPNAQSVERTALPAWTDALAYPRTEYDLALEGLTAEGVTTVDLRTVLRASPEPRYLLTDTHWNNRSSVLAFNAVMVAAGHPGWQVDTSQVVGDLRPAARGDLLRNIRMPPEVKEENFRLNIPDRASAARSDPALRHHNEHIAFGSVVRDYAPTGTRVLIMGDSFTAVLWPRLFVNADVSVVGWMHASLRVTGACDFNFDDVKDFAPDLLIIARTERFFPCVGGNWPVGLPRPLRGAIPRNAAP